MKKIMKNTGKVIGGMAVIIAELAGVLLVVYIGYKLVDGIFLKNNESEATQTQQEDFNKDNKEIKEKFLVVCMQTGRKEAECTCVYNGVWAEFSTEELKQIITTDEPYTPGQKAKYNKVYSNCKADNRYYL